MREQATFTVKRLIATWIRFASRHLKRFLKSNKTVRNLLYDVDNVAWFSTLLAHEQMLADTVRLAAYRAAIRRYVTPGDIVVDLGTGTGILSLFASERQPRRIYAIDHSNLIEIAKQIAEHNHVNNISFIRVNSRDFTLTNERADIIIHEQLSGSLFGENMINNLMDLKRRVLKSSGIILPGKFELYVEPVCLKPSYRVPYIWERQIYGLDFGFLRGAPDIEKYKADGYQWRRIPSPFMSYAVPRECVDYFLCRPVPLLKFDMNAWGDSPELPSLVEVSRKVTRAGQMDGLYVYFKVIFDSEISIDTSPLSPSTSWPNYFFRSEGQFYPQDAELSYSLEMTEITDIQKWRLSINHGKSRGLGRLPT
jgi:protein arginine N-methyltransferase 1